MWDWQGRAMCAVQFRDGKVANDLMPVLGFNEAVDQLAIVNSALVGSCIRMRS